jgi:hypothetical protein
MQPSRRRVGSKGDRPPMVVLFLRAWTRQDLGLPGGSYPALAEEMTEAGFPVTVDVIKKARSRGALPEHALGTLTPDEERFLAWAFARWPALEVERLVAPGSPAAAAVAELRLGAGATSPTGYERMWHRHPIRQRGASGTGGMSRQNQRLGGRCHVRSGERTGPPGDQTACNQSGLAARPQGAEGSCPWTWSRSRAVGDLRGGSGRSWSCSRGGQHEGEIIAHRRDGFQGHVAGPLHRPFIVLLQ